jgi:hypothetical protein
VARCPLPARLDNSNVAHRLDELRDPIKQLAAAELPKGFGRD